MVRSYLKAAHAVQKRLDAVLWNAANPYSVLVSNRASKPLPQSTRESRGGDDLRRDPLNVDARQRARASGAGLRLNEHLLVQAQERQSASVMGRDALGPFGQNSTRR
jgi:hypothetical protein